ncbi:hypothetical protein C8F04DRAFT_1273229 [Mycena alexandri]|uniref:Uncharacterized protein n=1 Tax=Mycena alexandri TaxID=1745969 RepID=A0AAD6S8M5_9AGAR|nr:hypothetical protein C8F04DRAFT_1273229 [Mycena alexandri]
MVIACGTKNVVDQVVPRRKDEGSRPVTDDVTCHQPTSTLFFLLLTPPPPPPTPTPTHDWTHIHGHTRRPTTPVIRLGRRTTNRGVKRNSGHGGSGFVQDHLLAVQRPERLAGLEQLVCGGADNDDDTRNTTPTQRAPVSSRGGALASAATQGGMDALEELRLLKDH